MAQTSSTIEMMKNSSSDESSSSSSNTVKIDEDRFPINDWLEKFMKNSSNISEKVQKFYSSVKEFYCAACTYVKKKIPLQDEFFSHALVADVKRRTVSEFASVKYFADLFRIKVDLDLLEMEFAMYQNEVFCADILEEVRVDAIDNFQPRPRSLPQDSSK
ncbi:hypothetical protein JTE90_026941 [Oedothorax gibbosus]|uniref:Uncharacterized protein n=1 Tax=Oedothorax gibbosus TaxID=931172 RepID=A0AAV6TW13_9ARAC|nr:hypothetical protein JTE90_026941 [Oedothorax gibbosus]